MYIHIKKICDSLVAILLIGIIGIVSVLGIPILLGNKAFAVLTGSMSPAYPIGSIVFVSEVKPEEIRSGDVITFQISGFNTLVTHRVIDIDHEKRQFTTKGDSNKSADFAPVPFENLCGRVVYGVPHLGYFSAFIRTGKGTLMIAGIIIFNIILFILPEIFKPVPDADIPKEEGSKKKPPKEEGGYDL